ncbi:MAG: alpha/beta fold hydrolase [Polyangiaceae bacterium]
MEMVERTVEVETADVRLSCLVVGEGPVVLALHGFPDHRGAFRPIVPALVSAGYQVVMPALRGYWPSGVSRSGRHDALSAGEDAILLADHFSPGERIRLVGHDWGAVVSFAAVSRAAHRVSHLATMAVPHPAAVLRRLTSLRQLRRSWYMGLFQVRGVAEERLSRDDFAFIDRLWRDWSPGYRATGEEMEAVKAGIRERVGPVLQYYRALFSPSRLRHAGAMFGKVRVPAIHLHGVDDGCIGVECSEGAERFYADRYSVHRVAGAGHFLVQERPEEVGRILTGFFAS